MVESKQEMKLKMVCKAEKYKPCYGNPTDACMDMKVVVPEGEVTIQPMQYHKFSTGIQVAVPEGKVLLVRERSSVGIKLHCMLANSTGIIDAGYRDEINICLINLGEEPVTIQDGQRIGQMMVQDFYHLEPIFVEDNEDFRQGDRGGGIGSTGKF